MSLLVRKIRKSRWYRNHDWLTEVDIQADSLGDLSTKQNRLSVWFVEEDESNLERIITALAANCDTLSNFDYALFSEDILARESIKIEKSRGISKDSDANDRWHRDICELSAAKLLSIAQHISNKGEINRIQEREVGKHISKAVQTGRIKLETLKPGIQSKILINP